MECITEIHNVPNQPGRQRMDLHCVKPISLENGKVGRGCQARCHMGVITEDPKEWVCHDYNFSFKDSGRIYYLHSQDVSVDYYHQGVRLPQTTLNGWGEPLISLPYFIPLSTNNDMHERAWELFHRLRNLTAFA